VAAALDHGELAVEDVDGGDAAGGLIAVERLQQADKEAHAKGQHEDQRQHRPPHAYRAFCVGGNSGNRGALASAVKRSAW
jgi:hypothetical protein